MFVEAHDVGGDDWSTLPDPVTESLAGRLLAMEPLTPRSGSRSDRMTTGNLSAMGEMRQRLADEVRRIAFQRSFAHRSCEHAAVMDGVVPQRGTCASCDRAGIAPVRLRMCLTCGAVGCCDSSPGRHARSHHEATGHPVIRSIEPGEAWAWCYPDQTYLGSVPIPA
jgi:uncharacterized UBP type Zn finger protein